MNELYKFQHYTSEGNRRLKKILCDYIRNGVIETFPLPL